jgi:tRNA pseudouridine55 synthase
LGCGAHLVELRRTAVGPFGLADAIAPETVAPGEARDPAALVAGLPRRTLEPAERDAVMHGRPLTVPGNGATGMVALFDGDALLAVAEWVGDVLKPRVVLEG